MKPAPKKGADAAASGGETYNLQQRKTASVLVNAGAGLCFRRGRSAVNTEYMAEFVKLAKRLNFTEAANELHITQSTLSKHMLALERELEVRLFVRQASGMRLTDEGYLFLGTAVNVLETIATTKAAMARLRSVETITIDGQFQDPGISGVLSLATMENNEGLRVPIRFNRDHSRSPLDLLEQGEVDLLVMGETEAMIQERGFAYQLLLQAPFVALLDQSHPLASRSRLTLDDLRDETFVRFLDEYSNPGWRNIEEACLAHGFVPKCRSVMVQSVTEQLATPLLGCVLVFPGTSRELRILANSSKRVTVPIEGEDAFFATWCIYRPEEEGRLAPFIGVLQRGAQNMGELRPWE